MSNKVVHIAKQLLNINDDVQYRFNFSKDNHRVTVDDFDLPLDEAYPTYESAENDLPKRRIK